MRRLLLALTALAGLAAAGPAGALELSGQATQGGLMVGRAAAGSTAELDGRQLLVAPDGEFLFGFGRDAGPEAQLAVTGPDGSVERRTIAVAPRSFDIQRIDGLPPKMVTPPKEVLDRIRRENAEIAKVRAEARPEALYRSGWAWPATGRISGVYGSQRILNGEPRQPHYGVDIAVPDGTPVKAPADGVVVLAERDLYYTGGTVLIDHGYGLMSAFLHLQSIDVPVGTRVRKGEVFAHSGKTGRATGPHLDWRVNLFDVRIDAQLLVPPMPAE